MKSLTLAAGLATLAFGGTAASAAVVSLGGPLSKNCYEAALARDNRDQAIEGCSRSLDQEALMPHDRAGTLVNRGILYMTRNNAEAADADFDAALAVDKSLSDAWLNKGFLRLKEGDGRDALPLLQKGIETGARRQALAIFARGVAHEQMGDYRLAYADLKRAQELEPGWSLPTEYLANYRLVGR
jgi:tetratricopeptide (TPR) repeat protein